MLIAVRESSFCSINYRKLLQLQHFPESIILIFDAVVSDHTKGNHSCGQEHGRPSVFAVIMLGTRNRL